MVTFVSDLARTIRRFFEAIIRPSSITVAPVGQPGRCDDPGTAPCGTSRQCGTTQAMVAGATGGLAEYGVCGAGPHTVVWSQGGLPG